MLDDGYWESLLRERKKNGIRGNQGEIWRTRSANGMPMARRPRTPVDRATPRKDEADWQRAAELLESGESITITITGYNRGGLLADSDGTRFHPGIASADRAALAHAGPAHDGVGSPDGGDADRAHRGDRPRTRRLILSERLARQDDHVDDLLASLQPGQERQGRVTNLCPFGAFVDLGGYEGLIHISELSLGARRLPGENRAPRR